MTPELEYAAALDRLFDDPALRTPAGIRKLRLLIERIPALFGDAFSAADHWPNGICRDAEVLIEPLLQECDAIAARLDELTTT